MLLRSRHRFQQGKETIRSRQEIMVATSIARNKRKLPQPKSSLLDTNMVTMQQSKLRLQVDDSQKKLLSKCKQHEFLSRDMIEKRVKDVATRNSCHDH